MIDSYEFGRIVIDGKEYTEDVLIFPNKVESWWRKEGHELSMEDLEEVFKAEPETIIIGTGHSGVMSVPQDVSDQIKAKGIELEIQKTGDAYKTYNALSSVKKVVACLHLTC